MHDDRDPIRRPGADEDTRRWGYDPTQDTRARGVGQDERQFGGDRGEGGYDGDRRGDADDPRAPRARWPRYGRDDPTRFDAARGDDGARDDLHRDDRAAFGGDLGGNPGGDLRGDDRGDRHGGRRATGRGPADTDYQRRSEAGRQGEWLGGAPERDASGPRARDSGYGTTRPGEARADAGRFARDTGRGNTDRGERDNDRGERDDGGRASRRVGPGGSLGDDARRRGLAGQSLYGPGDWGGRDGNAHDRDRDDAGSRDARRGDAPSGDGGYGGPTGVGGMGSQGPWGDDAGRGGRSHITRRGGWGGPGGGNDDPAGLGDMGGFGGLGHGPRDEPDIDDVREPGRAQHLAAGSGGSGDWTASAAGSGQRRGAVERDVPFEVARTRAQDGPDDRFGAEHYGDDRGARPPGQTAPGRSYGGWDGAAGSMQARWVDAPPPESSPPRSTAAPPAARDAGDRPRGPKGWRRSDDRIRDDVCERLARAEHLDASDVAVEVRDGHVTLEGTVSDRPMKHAIETLVDGCLGVVDIDNRIKVMRMASPPGSDGPPTPNRSVPQDSPTARDEARGRATRLPRDGSGYLG